MSILIKGMEMPENCVKCLCFERCYTRGIFDPLGWCHITGTELLSPNPPQDCPLVHVPPHGRLGDLDALYEKFARLESEAMSALKTTNTGSVNWIKWSAILTERTGYKFDIADAPTIIPADPAEED